MEKQQDASKAKVPAAREIMSKLGCSQPTAYKLIRQNEIDIYQIGNRSFLKPGALDRFIERGGTRRTVVGRVDRVCISA